MSIENVTANEGENTINSSTEPEPVWSILPSYYMYSNTINTGLYDTQADPPEYDLETSLSRSSTIDESIATYDHEYTPHVIEREGCIKDNLVDNAHLLTSLSSNLLADALEISLTFTTEPGAVNNTNCVIEPSCTEYHQGDYIHGFVNIINNGRVPVPFESFSVVLEGQYAKASILNSSSKVNKFLQMYDFSASYNMAFVESSVFEQQETVQSDNKDARGFGVDRLVYPNITYKRYFSFKLPTKLLDSTCSHNELTSHTDLPTSLGDATDFSPINSSVNYGIWARFIGKKTKYLHDVVNDAFVVVKEEGSQFRVVPYFSIESTTDCNFDTFFESVNDSISYANSLINTSTSKEIFGRRSATSTEKSPLQQCPPSLQTPIQKPELLNELSFPIYKASKFGKFSQSCCGTLSIKSAKRKYDIDYVPPKQFRNASSFGIDSWKLHIPLEFSLQDTGSKRLVEVKSVTSELVIITVESINNSIPMEINPDYVLNKSPSHEKDTFQNNLILPCRNLKKELGKLCSKLEGTGSNWNIEEGLIQGLKALADLSVKTATLPVSGTTIESQINWKAEISEWTSSMSVDVDLTTAVQKSKDGFGYDSFTLVPNFQICHLCRLYYVKLNLLLTNGQSVFLKIPVNVVNQNK